MHSAVVRWVGVGNKTTKKKTEENNLTFTMTQGLFCRKKLFTIFVLKPAALNPPRQAHISTSEEAAAAAGTAAVEETATAPVDVTVAGPPPPSCNGGDSPCTTAGVPPAPAAAAPDAGAPVLSSGSKELAKMRAASGKSRKTTTCIAVTDTFTSLRSGGGDGAATGEGATGDGAEDEGRVDRAVKTCLKSTLNGRTSPSPLDNPPCRPRLVPEADKGCC